MKSRLKSKEKREERQNGRKGLECSRGEREIVDETELEEARRYERQKAEVNDTIRKSMIQKEEWKLKDIKEKKVIDSGGILLEVKSGRREKLDWTDHTWT